MVKPGDTVRYLNDVGGGTVTRVEGKIAYVDDGGFETPVLAAELVVVAPAGLEKQKSGAKLMFDQRVRDAAATRDKAEKAPKQQVAPAEPKAEEIAGKDKVNVTLAFEPSSTREFTKATFTAVLVNDSNYYLDFVFSRRGGDERQWTVVYRDTVAPNELIDLAVYTREQLPEIECVSLQALPYKKGKGYERKETVDVERRLDLTKFHKLHCFRPGIYFDTPVLEITLFKDDGTPKRSIADAEKEERDSRRRLQEKFNVDAPRKEKHRPDSANPHKLLPLIEVDLHIGELTDTTSGMDNTAMMEMQLDTVRKVMKENSRRIGQKIVFIHGKGEGVLRKAVHALLHREWPKATLQDASFREYGFGATLVTIH